MAKRQGSSLVRFTARSVWNALLLTLMALTGGALLAPSPAHAASHTGNYQLDVVVTNSGPFSYGGSTAPSFQATLTALNGTTLSSCTGNGSTFVTISFDSDPSANWGSTSQSVSGTNTCVYTFVDGPPDWSYYAPGVRTATAQATVSGQIVATGTVTFTIDKVVTSISCFVSTAGPVYQAGSMLQIAQEVNGPNTAYNPDWTQSKYDVTFTGPTSVTYTNLTPDTTPGAGWLNVKAPTTPGAYNMTCAFDGYGNYAPSTSANVAVTVSAFNAIGGIQLYTNPTTYSPYQSCDVYVVFQSAPGSPLPTGGAFIKIGYSSTAVMYIASNGTLTAHLDPQQQPYSAGNQIKINYMGDSYYQATSSTFSFTNPAIPGGPPTSGGGGSGGGGSTGSSQATTTATAPGTTSTATPAPAATQIASTLSSGSSSAGSRSSGGSPLLWIILAVLVLGLGSGGVVLVVRARRANPMLSVPVQASGATERSQSPNEPPLSTPADW